jgi:hypothetical protein
MAEDCELFLRIAREYEVDFVDEPLAHYRVHASNFSRNRVVYYGEWIEMWAPYVRKMHLQGRMADLRLRFGRALLQEGRYGKASGSIGRGIWEAIRWPARFFLALRRDWADRCRQRSLRNS